MTFLPRPDLLLATARPVSHIRGAGRRGPALFVVFVLAALQSASPGVADDAAEPSVPPAGFVALFNGKDLSGWKGLGHFNPQDLRKMSPEERAKKEAADREDMTKHWTVEDGELVNDGHGVFLTTEKEYGDFELLIDYKTVPKADSGIYLRGTPQVQIWDSTDEEKFKLGADKGSGGLWNNAGAGKHPFVLADKPLGEWNHFRILMVGENVTVWLNDQLVVNEAPLDNFWEKGKPVYPVGPIQLQTHGGEIRWRNIFIREIPRQPPEVGVLDHGKPVGDGWQLWVKTDAGTPLRVTSAPVDNFELHATLTLPESDSEGTVLFRTREAGSDRQPGYGLRIGREAGVSLIHGEDESQLRTIAEFEPKSPGAIRADKNHLYLRVRGDYLEAWLNGTKVIDLLDPSGPRQGQILLAPKTPDVTFDAVAYRPASDWTNKPELPADEDGFVSLFNGEDLSGWTGDTDGYEAENGKLVSPAKGGGNLFTEKDYSDFILRFEFKLERGGNNGVGLRAERGKNAAYYGIESQILDNTATVYRNLQPWQVHGSLYGVVAAKRGAQAPLGYWNTQEIAARGNRITVTLNGEKIVDADIEQAGKPMTIDGKEHPGLFNKTGAIGFLGHGHRIEFRNLRIKDLSEAAAK